MLNLNADDDDDLRSVNVNSLLKLQYSLVFFHQPAHHRREGDRIKRIKILHPTAKTPR